MTPLWAIWRMCCGSPPSGTSGGIDVEGALAINDDGEVMDHKYRDGWERERTPMNKRGLYGTVFEEKGRNTG